MAACWMRSRADGRSRAVNLIIGIGSMLRRDDGLGPDLARHAAESLSSGAHAVALLLVTQLTPELAEPISRAERVVFIDAADTADAAPGTIMAQPVAPDMRDDAAFTHQASPGSLLAAARDWYGHAPAALLIAVQGADFSIGEGLSAALAARIDAIRAAVGAQVAAFFAP